MQKKHSFWPDFKNYWVFSRGKGTWELQTRIKTGLVAMCVHWLTQEYLLMSIVCFEKLGKESAASGLGCHMFPTLNKARSSKLGSDKWEEPGKSLGLSTLICLKCAGYI